MHSIELPTDGICRNKQEMDKLLRNLPGVTHIYTNPDIEMVRVEFDAKKITPGEIFQAAQSVGCITKQYMRFASYDE